jgi:citrate synthase
MKRNVLTAKQVATRLGVKLETIYAYVSRGVLSRTLADDGKTSRFDPAEVERLAKHGRPRAEGGRVGTVDVSLATAITEIHADRLLFRGQDAVVLARTSSFEQVAELLWSGAKPDLVDRDAWTPPAKGFRIAHAASRPLPPTTLPVERFAVVCAAVACTQPLRGDLRAATVIAHARALIATFVEALPLVGKSAPAANAGIAARLWPRLSPLAPTADAVALIDAALVLLADHELATSTFAARVAASARADPFSVVLAGLGTIAGKLHGRVARVVHEVFVHAAAMSPEIAVARALDDGVVGLGLGHPVYRGVDPRAAYLLDRLTPLLKRDDRRRMADIQRIAAGGKDAPPSVDFALGALAFALQMPVGATEAVFAIARTAGWIAHALEEYGEAPLRFRARAVYIGPEARGG